MTGSDADDIAATLVRHVPPGGLVAVGDGAGAPVDILPAVRKAAEYLGRMRVFTGWGIGPAWGMLDHPCIDVVTFMGGYGMRTMLAEGRATYLPARLGSLPALLAGPLRPDVLIASGRRTHDGWIGGAEIGWVPAAAEAAGAVVLRLDGTAPSASRCAPIGTARVVATVDDPASPPVAVPEPGEDATAARIAEHVVSLLPEGAAIQYGPGVIAAACLRRIDRRVAVVSGVVTDAVVDLDERGLLLRDPVAAYAVGTERLYGWLEGRPVLDRVEVTHDVSALARLPFFALNTALEIDTSGQVNVERIGEDVIAGVGGHADFALAGARSVRGLSIVALPSRRKGRPTLVERLAVPTSTSRSDVDVVANEHGWVDLRMLGAAARRRALLDLWQLDSAPAG